MIQTPLKAATIYAQLGWLLFPIGPDCRRPWIKGGCHSATNDPDMLARIFRGSCNVALACGEASGVFALDVDVKGVNGFDALALLEDEHGQLPDCPRQDTPSGGAHLLFRQPARPIRNRVIKPLGLDVRTNGGSIALAPSRKEGGGAYRWRVSPGDLAPPEAPEWLLDIIDPPEPPRVPAPPLRFDCIDRAARYVEAAVLGECREVAEATSPGRNQRLFIASARIGELVGGNLLPETLARSALEDAAKACGLWQEDGPHAVIATIASGLRKGAQKPRSLEVAHAGR
jgi:hypothetical protein